MAAAKKYTGKQALQDLRKGVVRPIYYLFGEDLFTVEAVLDELHKLINPAFKDFNYHSFIAGDVSGDAVAVASNQLPMMDDKVLILVKGVKQWKAADWEPLLPYFERPAETTCLVFLEPEMKPSLDKRTKVGKALQKYFVSCMKPYDNEMPKWVHARSKQHKISLSSDACYLLLELLGSNLASLNNALERLSLYIGGKGDVDVSHVKQVITEARSYNVFQLSELVAQKKTQQALKLLQGLLYGGEPPLRLMTLLVKAFRQLLLAKIDLQAGLSNREIDSKYISPKIRYQRDVHLKRFLKQLRLFSLDELTNAMHLLHQTEKSFKSTSGLTPKLLMERLILQLCLK